MFMARLFYATHRIYMDVSLASSDATLGCVDLGKSSDHHASLLPKPHWHLFGIWTAYESARAARMWIQTLLMSAIPTDHITVLTCKLRKTFPHPSFARTDLSLELEAKSIAVAQHAGLVWFTDL